MWKGHIQSVILSENDFHIIMWINKFNESQQECEMRGELKTNKNDANTNNMFYINMKLS